MRHSPHLVRNRLVTALSVLAACSLFIACGDDTTSSDDPAPTTLEVAGVWNDNFGGWVAIGSDYWGTQRVHQYDNAANWAVTQNPADDEYGPSKYSHVVWTDAVDGTWWTCTVAFGLDTAEEALAAENTSDASDPANGGCGDFAWTQMTPRAPIEVEGEWTDNYGGSNTITVMAWGAQRIHKYDNDANWAVTQNAADAEYSPSKFNYVVWTETVDGSFWTCTVAFDIETLEEATAVENTSDDSDPGTAGCGDFPWTQMTRGT